ncbi:unnamed protein product [Adineta steineri]|uniref:Uncharacterized protein n=1 Tax=Adineta steineri TaxID=433720 RepID=A0A814HNA9_9BILA|nr:unnamed protein product [Adineta steineri]
MSCHLFLVVTLGILYNLVSCISGHAYFIYPTPRNTYCTNSSCTTAGALGAQGPIWSLLANSTLSSISPTTQTTCNGSTLILAAPVGNTYDPGFQGKTAASWSAGSIQTFQIFVSQLHSIENQTIYPTDGWQIRYRDGTQTGSTFSPINFTYVNVSTTPSIGPAPGAGFQLGQIVFATITVPSSATNDGIFQFFWRNNEVYTGFMWLSCIDITITSFGTNIPVPSIFTIIIAALLTIGSVVLHV